MNPIFDDEDALMTLDEFQSNPQTIQSLDASKLSGENVNLKLNLESNLDFLEIKQLVAN